MTLAYVFWHERGPDVDGETYRNALRAFHQRFRQSAPAGFIASRSLQYDAVPWLASKNEIYEDWYFVRDSAALDVIEAAAIAAFNRETHDNVARMAGNATAGLYKTRSGEPIASPSHMSWLSKPRGETYEAFIGNLAREGTVWCRMMVLGPTPEFCIESTAAPRRSTIHPLRPAATVV